MVESNKKGGGHLFVAEAETISVRLTFDGNEDAVLCRSGNARRIIFAR